MVIELVNGGLLYEKGGRENEKDDEGKEGGEF